MTTAMENVIRYAEYLLLGSFPHFVSLIEIVPGNKLEVITSLESGFKPQCTEELIRSVIPQAEKIRKNEQSAYGFRRENTGAVCIGWKNIQSNAMTSAILVWAMKNSLPPVRVTRIMSFEAYSKVLQETLLWPQDKTSPNQFHILPEEESILGLLFEANNQTDSIKWEFTGAAGTLLKEYLQKEMNWGNISSKKSDLSPKLILSFET